MYSKPEIVKFEDGAYAVRRRFILNFQYADIKWGVQLDSGTSYKWHSYNNLVLSKVTTLQEAKQLLQDVDKYLLSSNKRPDYGYPIK